MQSRAVERGKKPSSRNETLIDITSSGDPAVKLAIPSITLAIVVVGHTQASLKNAFDRRTRRSKDPFVPLDFERKADRASVLRFWN